MIARFVVIPINIEYVVDNGEIIINNVSDGNE